MLAHEVLPAFPGRDMAQVPGISRACSYTLSLTPGQYSAHGHRGALQSSQLVPQDSTSTCRLHWAAAEDAGSSSKPHPNWQNPG